MHKFIHATPHTHATSHIHKCRAASCHLKWLCSTVLPGTVAWSILKHYFLGKHRRGPSSFQAFLSSDQCITSPPMLMFKDTLLMLWLFTYHLLNIWLVHSHWIQWPAAPSLSPKRSFSNSHEAQWAFLTQGPKLYLSPGLWPFEILKLPTKKHTNVKGREKNNYQNTRAKTREPNVILFNLSWECHVLLDVNFRTWCKSTPVNIPKSH